ncbi:MAG TPA: TonB family protein [Puia sp.]|jgi:TonB family protein
MENKNYKLTKSFVIATFALCGLAACNNSDYKTDNSSSDSSSMTAAPAADKVATDKMPTDTSNATAITSPAPAPGTSADSASPMGKTSVTEKPVAASKSFVAKRKGKMSIKMPAINNTEKMAMDKDGVYNWAEAAPEFPGGQNALDNYVNNNIDYPAKAIDDNTTGTVRVSFVVDEHGKVSRAHIVGNKLGNGLDEQALKVVNNMPAWKPGKVHGKNVKTRLELPIAFQVEA